MIKTSTAQAKETKKKNKTTNKTKQGTEEKRSHITEYKSITNKKTIVS